jgi:hypothetical protein
LSLDARPTHGPEQACFFFFRAGSRQWDKTGEISLSGEPIFPFIPFAEHGKLYTGISLHFRIRIGYGLPVWGAVKDNGMGHFGLQAFLTLRSHHAAEIIPTFQSLQGLPDFLVLSQYLGEVAQDVDHVCDPRGTDLLLLFGFQMGYWVRSDRSTDLR